MDLKAILTGFVSEELLDLDEPVSADESLLAEGMVDSLGMMRLVAFIEQEFGYKVPAGDLTIQNFRTIGVLSDYLDHSLGDAEKGAGHA